MKYDIGNRPVVKEGQILQRAFVCDVVRVIDKAQQIVDFVISTERVDRYGDVITVKGWDLKEYKKNPVVLFAHNSHVPPIGKAIKVWKDPTGGPNGSPALRAQAQFMAADVNPFAYSIFRMYADKYLRATSVGFLPVSWEMIQEEGDTGSVTGYKFTNQELLEFSCVPIPANPDALVDARAKGIDTAPIKQWAEQSLDEWSTVGEPMMSLYGVTRKAMETIRRKAAGAGFLLNVPVDQQDDLLARNLAAAKKAKEETAPMTIKVALKVTGKDEPVEFDLPEMAAADADEYGEVELMTFDTEGVHSVEISDYSAKAKFAARFASDGDLVSVTEDGPQIILDAANIKLIYNIVGARSIPSVGEDHTDAAEDRVLYVKLVKAETKEKPVEEEKILSSTNLKDLDMTTTTVKTVVEEVVKEAEEEVDKDEDEVVLDDAPGLITEMKDVMSEKVSTGFVEAVLVAYEQALDKQTELRQSPSRHEKRKMLFLAGYMREVAQRLDPQEETVRTVSEERVAVETNGVDKEELDKFLSAHLGPKLTSIVQSEINKLRGRLD